MMRRAMARCAVGLGALVSVLLFAGTVGVVVLGVPKPPAVSTENVGRVGWRPILANLEHTLRIRRSASFAAWMPDGERILIRAAYRVLDNRLYLLAGPGASRDLIPFLPRNVSGIHTAPGRDHVILRWDSDGTERFQLYLWRPDGSDPERITDGSERAFFGAFAPDGQRFAYLSNQRNGRDMDVYVADAARPGSAKRVLEVTGTWAVFDWSPTDDRLLLARIHSNVSSELYTFDLKTRTLEPLMDLGHPHLDLGRRLGGRPLMDPEPPVGPDHAPVAVTSAQWSKDGRSLYVITDLGTEFRHLRRLDLERREVQVLTKDISWDVMSVQESFDGSRVVLMVNDDGRNAVYVLNLDNNRLQRLRLPVPGLITGADLHPEKPLLALNHSDPLGVARGYVYDLESGHLELWTGPKPKVADVPDPRLIRYPTFDDVDGAPRMISAFVYPGVGSGPRPVVIDIHGGPEAQARMSHGYVALQRTGVTLIAPNIRGSTGYGKTFTSLDDTWRREDAVRDVGSLLDWIAGQPTMDAERVAVRGAPMAGIWCWPPWCTSGSGSGAASTWWASATSSRSWRTPPTIAGTSAASNTVTNAIQRCGSSWNRFHRSTTPSASSLL